MRKTEQNAMLNPGRVILNLVQNLFMAGLVHHLIKSKTYETLKWQTLILK